MMNKIKRTFLWNILRKAVMCIRRRKYKKYNGKPLTQAIQTEIQNIIRQDRAIYFHSEETAKRLADNWQGTVNKPDNLRFIENAIPVVFCANDSFAPYAAVMLQSILYNSNPQRIYHFIFFEQNFSDITKDYLVKQVSHYSYCLIDFVNTKDAFMDIPISPTRGSHINIDAFSRLFIPYWLNRYSKVIYCDCDMMANSDIAEMFDLDIHDYCMGAAVNDVIEAALHRQNYSSFFSPAAFMLLENWSRYINSGLLIFNTRKFSEMFSYQNLFKFAIYYTNRYKKRKNDQDVLSLIVKDNYYVLPPEWNHCWETMKTAGPNIKIIHYTSNVKPWKDFREISDNPDVLAYRNFAKNVPLYQITHPNH